LPLPDYNVVGEVGPDHDKRFIVEVKIGSLVARGEGSSKKKAQQQAAKHALAEFRWSRLGRACAGALRLHRAFADESQRRSRSRPL